jgi:hypothetical protein
VLDRGAGVVKSAAARAVKGLVEKGVVSAVRNASEERGYEPTTYALRFKQTAGQGARDDPMSSRRTRDVLQKDRPMSSKGTYKQQYLQEIGSSKGESASTPRPSRGRAEAVEETPQLDQVVAELSEVLGDRTHAASNRAQARNLLASSGLAEEQLVGRMFEALSVTKDRARDNQVEARAPYFFAVLRDLLGLKQDPDREAQPPLNPTLPSAGPADLEDPGELPRVTTAPMKEQTKDRRARPIPRTLREPDEPWRSVLELLALELSPAALRTYLANSELIEIHNGHAVIGAANAFVADQLEERFAGVVRRALSAATGAAVTVSFAPRDEATRIGVSTQAGHGRPSQEDTADRPNDPGPPT